MKAAVLDYDLGNLPSVTKALERIGVEASIASSPDEIDADVMVVPGVGHFGTGMRNLRERGFDTAIRGWAAAGKPLLGICVGLQLFMDSSDEDPDEQGLGIVHGHVRRLSSSPKVPHMGWNTLEVSSDARVLSAVQPGDMTYFVHSYYVDPDPSVVAATTTYGETFCSGVEQDNVVGVQFHPEKSADVGRRLLERYFECLP